MKTSKILSAILLTVISLQPFFAQNITKESLIVSGTKFTHPLVEKWINEYSLIHPGVKITIAAKTSDPKLSDLRIIAHSPSEAELAKDQKLFLVAKYALLPVASKNNPLAVNAKKSLNKKDLDKLFFEESILEESSGKVKPFTNLNIYSREGQACASIAFAEYFGRKPIDIRGKKISGDDIFLLTAIQKDSLGVTFNNLGYIFDLKSRAIKNGVSILPIDLKKNKAQSLNNNLDEAIQLLESNSYETVPVEKIGFVFNGNDVNPVLRDFLKWVATEGQKYNHDYGFLNLEKETLSNQVGLIDNKYLSSTN